MCFKTKGLFKCGKCPECLQTRRLQWSLRLMQHAREYGCFSALLTYSPEKVPMTKDGQMTLSKKDVQLFLMRLRHHVPKGFKYFIAAEYSPEKFRPHYHCLFFGFDKISKETDTPDKIKALLQKTWQNGFIGSRSNWLKSNAQINYTTGYLINLYDWKDDDHRVRPFNLISKGLATDYHPTEENKILRDYDIKDFGWKFENGNWVFHNPFNAPIDNLVVSLDDGNLSVNMLDFITVDESFSDSLDSIQVLQEKYDIEKNETTIGKPHFYRMPRCWRERCLTYDEREFLNVIRTIKAYKDEVEYLKKYGEYDSKNDFPMWKQIKYHKWNQRKKSKKDKLLQNPDFYFI